MCTADPALHRSSADQVRDRQGSLHWGTGESLDPALNICMSPKPEMQFRNVRHPIHQERGVSAIPRGMCKLDCNFEMRGWLDGDVDSPPEQLLTRTCAGKKQERVQ